MAFTFLAGDSGTAGANSFATVAQYRDHFPGDGVTAAVGHNGDDLVAVTDDTIERVLVLAARWLTMVPWNGTTKTDSAAEVAEIAVRLPFPRYSCHVGNNAHPSIKGVGSIDDDVVPGVVVQAQIELAEEIRIREADGERLPFRGATDRRDALKSKKSVVGSAKAWADPTAPLTYPRVASLIRGLYTHSEHPMAIAV